MKKILIILTFLVLTGCSLLNQDQSGETIIKTDEPVFQNPDTPISNEPGQGGGGEPMNVNPQPGDNILQRGNVYLDSVEILMRETYPPQPIVYFSGNLPDPCHVLRITASIAPEGVINLDVYSLADPNMACIAVLAPFTYSLSLDQVLALNDNHFAVMVNGTLAGEFDMP